MGTESTVRNQVSDEEWQVRTDLAACYRAIAMYGFTAIQLDNKLGGLPAEVLTQAFDQARDGRLHILAEMAKTIEAPTKIMK